jgi:hypothetical protein
VANRSTKDPTVSAADTARILETILHPDIKDDPYAFVLYAFPWGKPNTPLANFKGPKKWQAEELRKIAAHIRENRARIARGEKPLVYKCAIASGRGIGKSAFVAMVVIWFISCIPGGSSIISANTDTQLTSKTFGEISKWLTLAINGFFFERTQKKITPTEWYAQQLRDALKVDSGKYYAEGILWNPDNPDAFAGEHSSIGMLLIFDEASGIPQPIFNVSDGFFTDLTLYRFWFCFSNPRKNTGPFFELFHAHRAFWSTRQIDSRAVEGLDTTVYDEIIAKHGEDSDPARVEVKGQFPSQGDHQFISRDVVTGAQARVLDRYDDHAALVMGVDPARFGDDSTVIRFRRGRDARSYPVTELKGLDNMKVANVVADLIEKFAPDGVFIDSGAGAGIIDRLKERGYKIYEVGFGTESKDRTYEDHRTEMWAKMRDWLAGAMIDNNQFLADDLTGPEYEFKGAEDRIKLESKEKMKKRGIASPNHADALCLTFSLTIPRYDSKLSRKNPQRAKARTAAGLDYKIFGGQR